MTYQDFKQHIISMLQTEIHSDVTISIQDILKNNGIHLDGLTILSKDSNYSPTIYLNYYFHQYECGKTLPAICDDILKIYRENRPSTNIDISFFTDYDKVKTHITFKLVNYEQNKELLSTIPHYRFLDLAIVFCCLLQSEATGNATILIHNHHLDLWEITRDDLYALAEKNTPVLLKHDLKNMTDLLKELFTDDVQLLSEFEPEDTAFCPMYVLTNHSKINGSICMLYPNLLSDIANHLGSDLFILPSSIHEVLLIPADKHTSCEDLTKMVREVNTSQLSPEEVLSDHVYYFSKETGQITM